MPQVTQKAENQPFAICIVVKYRMACILHGRPDDMESHCRVKGLKRLAYILLAVVLLQGSGLRLLCAPSRASDHECCPPAEKNPAPKTLPTPECCAISAVRFQTSTAKTPSGNERVRAAMQAAQAEFSNPVRPVATFLDARGVLPSISPPLSPLLQTCLLLI